MLFYTDEGESEPNLERAVGALDGQTADPATYTTEISALAGVVDAVFPTDETTAPDSMISGVFNNLEVTNRSFAAISGLPDEVTSAISEAIDDIRSVTQEVQGRNANAAAIRQRLTRDLSRRVSEQIESLPESATEEQVDAICEQFEAIAGLASEVERPAGCTAPS